MMPSTRSSARKTDQDAAPAASEASTGEKHQLEQDDAGTSSAKRGKKGDQKKKQITIEETLEGKDTEPKDNDAQIEEHGVKEDDIEMKDTGKETASNEDTEEETGRENGAKHGTIDKNGQKEESNKSAQSSTAAKEVGGAEDAGGHKNTPSSILEKGIIYFFFRGRVGIDNPSEVNDIARSYFILRPIAHDAKLSSGTIGDAGNTRLLALPKKVFPESGQDRYIVFVEKVGVSFKELKNEFLASNDYETKTAGTRHSPAATPIGEGVYAITTTGRESHLAYMLTLPEKLGEVQKEMGLREKGSFVLSTRNPQYPAPKNVALPQEPQYSKDVLDDFRSLRWMPTQPKHLDFVHSQVLLVGESSGIEKAIEPQEKGDEAKDDPIDELEKLEEEDTQRMKALSSDDSARVFADLEVHAKDYPKLQTTF